MTFTCRMAYDQACERLAAWERIMEAAEIFKNAIRAEVKDFDEPERNLMIGTFEDCIGDFEGNNDIQDLKDSIILEEDVWAA